MKSWLISIIAVCLLLVLLELLLSEGTTKKYIQGIIKLVIVIVMLFPIINLFKKEIKIEDIFTADSEVSTQDDVENKNTFVESIQNMRIKSITKQIDNEMKKLGKTTNTVITLTEKDEISCIEIYIKEIDINSTEKNIFTLEIAKTKVKEIVDVDDERIIIYEQSG